MGVALAVGVGLIPAASPVGPGTLAAAGSPVSRQPAEVLGATHLAGSNTDPSAEITRGQPAPPSAPGAVTAQDQERVTRYWTAQRQAQAFGAHSTARQDDAAADPPSTTTPLATADRDAAQTGPASAPPPPSTGLPYTGGGLVTTTTGRLFTSIGGADFACTASVVTSRSKDVLVTAGHCLHGGAGSRFATNVAFVPDYAHGSAPLGIWTARRLLVTPGWAQQSDFDVDLGFAAMNLRRDRHIQDVTGGQGIAFDLPTTYQQYSFGYPRLLPFDGSRLIYCAGPGAPDSYGGPSIGVRCSMTAGSSGGPLLASIGRLGPGHGWIDGVISYAYAGSDNLLYCTHFGSAARLLYYQVNDL